MTLELKKNQLVEVIMAIKNEALLNIYAELMRKAKIEAYEAILKPMSREELIQRALASEEDFKKGRVYSTDDLKKEFDIQ